MSTGKKYNMHYNTGYFSCGTQCNYHIYRSHWLRSFVIFIELITICYYNRFYYLLYYYYLFTEMKAKNLINKTIQRSLIAHLNLIVFKNRLVRIKHKHISMFHCKHFLQFSTDYCLAVNVILLSSKTAFRVCMTDIVECSKHKRSFKY